MTGHSDEFASPVERTHTCVACGTTTAHLCPGWLPARCDDRACFHVWAVHGENGCDGLVWTKARQYRRCGCVQVNPLAERAAELRNDPAAIQWAKDMKAALARGDLDDEIARQNPGWVAPVRTADSDSSEPSA